MPDRMGLLRLNDGLAPCRQAAGLKLPGLVVRRLRCQQAMVARAAVVRTLMILAAITTCLQ